MTWCQKFKKAKVFVVMCTLLPLSVVSHAESAGYKSMAVAPTTFWSQYWHPVLGLIGGFSLTQTGNSSSTFIPAADPLVDSYYNYRSTNTSTTQGIWGLFAGTEFGVRDNWGMQLGLNYMDSIDSYNQRGYVTQGPVLADGSPDVAASDTFTYRYNIKTNQVLGLAKLFYTWGDAHPYIAMGLGASYNEAQNFSVNIVPPNTTLSNNFGNHSQWSFSYSVGVGMDFDINPHWRIGAGYRFTDYGKAGTGNAVIDTGGVNNDGLVNPKVGSSNHLTMDHMYSNEVLGQISYLFG